MNRFVTDDVVRGLCALVPLGLVGIANADIASAEGVFNYEALTRVAPGQGAVLEASDTFGATFEFSDDDDIPFNLDFNRDISSRVQINAGTALIEGNTGASIERSGTSFELNARGEAGARTSDARASGAFDWNHEFGFEVTENTRIQGSFLIEVGRVEGFAELAASLTLEGLSEPISISYNNDGDDFFAEISFDFMAEENSAFALRANVETDLLGEGDLGGSFDDLQIRGDLNVSPAPGSVALLGMAGLAGTRRRR